MAQQNGNKIEEKLLFYINKLSNEDGDKIETIENVNALLIASNAGQIRSVANQLPLAEFFRWINNLTLEDELSERLIALVKLFFEALQTDQIMIKHVDAVLAGLGSPRQPIRELWLKKIVEPTFVDPVMLAKVVENNVNLVPVVQLVIRMMKNEDTSLVPSIQSIVLMFAKQYRVEFCSPTIINELCSILKSSEEIYKIRCFELCVSLAGLNNTLFNQIKSSGFIDQLVKAFEEALDKDPLVAINYVQLITDLISKQPGLEYIRTTSLASKMVELIRKEEDPLMSLIIPSLITFIVRIAEFDVNILSEQPAVMQKILQFCEERNPEFLFLAIDSIAYLCRKANGKRYIEPHAATIFKTLAWMINSANQDVKTRALEALTEILDVRDIESANQEIINLTERWFQLLATSGCPFARFVELLKDVTLRATLLKFICVLAQSAWGQVVLHSSDEFIEYLFNPNTEANKAARDAKHKVIQELSSSPFISQTFKPEERLRLRQCLKGGPQASDEAQVSWI